MRHRPRPTHPRGQRRVKEENGKCLCHGSRPRFVARGSEPVWQLPTTPPPAPLPTTTRVENPRFPVACWGGLRIEIRRDDDGRRGQRGRCCITACSPAGETREAMAARQAEEAAAPLCLHPERTPASCAHPRAPQGRLV